jgi:hypothetical protein
VKMDGAFHLCLTLGLGRETLASSGSPCSAASLQKRPVSEQRWLSPRDASDPVRWPLGDNRRYGLVVTLDDATRD